MKRRRAAESRPSKGEAAISTGAKQSEAILAEQGGLSAAVARRRDADEQRWAAFVDWAESQGLAGGLR